MLVIHDLIVILRSQNVTTSFGCISHSIWIHCWSYNDIYYIFNKIQSKLSHIEISIQRLLILSSAGSWPTVELVACEVTETTQVHKCENSRLFGDLFIKFAQHLLLLRLLLELHIVLGIQIARHPIGVSVALPFIFFCCVPRRNPWLLLSRFRVHQ